MCSDINVNQAIAFDEEHAERTELDKLSNEPIITRKRKRAKPRVETKECATQTSEREPNNHARTQVSNKLKRIHEKLQKLIRQMVE